MSTLVRACDYNWLLRFLWGSEFEMIQTKNRSVCENAVPGIWFSCRLLVMGSWLVNNLCSGRFYVEIYLSCSVPRFVNLNVNEQVVLYFHWGTRKQWPG